MLTPIKSMESSRIWKLINLESSRIWNFQGCLKVHAQGWTVSWGENTAIVIEYTQGHTGFFTQANSIAGLKLDSFYALVSNPQTVFAWAMLQGAVEHLPVSFPKNQPRMIARYRLVPNDNIIGNVATDRIDSLILINFNKALAGLIGHH